ncbi:MAG: roadblock/LC7 domain-containing protein [Candidatus Aminicenantia bacterium]
MTEIFVLYDEEYHEIRKILSRLKEESNSRLVFLADRNGQAIAVIGDLDELDSTALASLTAGNVAATDSLAKLLGSKSFHSLFHEGERENMHISPIGTHIILGVIFDEKTSLGLVRLRVKKASTELNSLFESIKNKKERGELPDSSSPLSEITDEDIEKLFRG